MADRRTTITLSVRDDFSRHLREYVRGMGDAVKITDDMEKSAKESGGSMEKFSHAMSGVYATVQNFQMLVGVVDQMQQLGVQSLNSKAALQSLTGAGAEYTAMIESVKDASLGAVTTGEAAAMAYQSMRMGMAETTDEMERFIHTATVIGRVNPQLGSTSEAISQITMAIANMSYMRLDQLGVSSAEVRKRVAELRNEIAGMTEEEAFKQAVMEGLDEQVQALGSSVLDTSDAVERLKTRWREFKESASEKVALNVELAVEAGEKIGGGAGVIEGLAQFFTLGNIDEARDYFGLDQPTPRTMADETPEGPVAYLVEQDRPIPINQFVDYISGAVRADFQDISAAEFKRYFQRELKGQETQRGKEKSALNIPLATRRSDRTFYEDERRGHEAAQQYIKDQKEYQAAVEATEDAARKYARESAMAEALEKEQHSAEKTARSLDDLTAKTVDLGNSWTSLAEKFGIGASAFDEDVYNQMVTALNDAGVATETLDAAIFDYEHDTGMANAASDLFAGYLKTLSDQLATGAISAAEYSDAVQKLADTDLGGLSDVMDQMFTVDPEQYQRVLDMFAAFDPAALMDKFTTTQETLSGFWGKAFGAEDEESPFATMTTQMDEATGAWSESVSSFSDSGVAAMERFGSASITQIQLIDAGLDALEGRTVDVKINMDMPELPTAGGGRSGKQGKTFAYGGYTGDGPAGGIAGSVHYGEFVIPRSVLKTLRGGGAGGSRDPARVVVQLDGRTIAEALADVNRQNNGGNTSWR